MDNIYTRTHDGVHHTQVYPSVPLHNYATVPRITMVSYPVESKTIASQSISAGVFGLIVVSTGVMGANLHKVLDGKMTMGQAAGDSIARGLAGGVAAASATAAAKTITSGGVAGLAVTLAAATGVSYLINGLTQ